jgi:hypothetical protein
MPQPIVPIHQQETMPILFGESTLPGFQLSEIQTMLLYPEENIKTAAKYSDNTIDALVNIDKNIDLVVTAFTESNERYCSVPAEINDNLLLGLKAEGLITGCGRSVKITDKGRIALRDHYLNSKNALRDSRSLEKFDYKSFSRIASKKEK